MNYRYTKSSDGTTTLKELQGRYIGIKNTEGKTVVGTVTQIYHTVLEDGKVVAKLVWQLVSSCFGAGYWRNDYPWKDTDAWCNK